jgi:signal transduction histidine kinase
MARLLGLAPTAPDSGKDFANLVVHRLVTVALLYRALIIPIAIVGFLVEHVPMRHWHLVLIIIAALSITNCLLAWRVARGSLPGWFKTPGFLLADVSVAALLNIGASVLIPHGALAHTSRDLFSPYIMASMALWVGVWGPLIGLALLGGGGLLEFSMLLENHVALSRSVTEILVLRTLWIGAGWIVAAFVLSFATQGARLVARRGQDLGEERERARLLRAMHDTVLQTLEAIATRAEASGQPWEDRLTEIARAARAQSSQLRSSLRRADEPPNGLYEQLAAMLIAFESRTGASADLVPLGPPPEVTAASAEALLGAVGEALRNVENHASATRINLFAEVQDDRLRIVIKDDGGGFNPAHMRPEALGIVQSIVGRLEDVGGGARIESRPGSGTRVELWVPLAPEATRSNRLGVYPSGRGFSRWLGSAHGNRVSPNR